MCLHEEESPSMTVLGDSTEIVKEVVKGGVENAGNPWWVIGFGFLGTLAFLCTLIIVGGVYGIKPLVDAQIESVHASTEAIKSNAETNRRMEAAIAEIREIDRKRADHDVEVDRQMTTAISDIKDMDNKKMKILETIVDSSAQSLKDHQKIMNAIQQCSPQRPPNGT